MASIVVVGGGVAGLTCAWRLRRAGHAVEVLDREQELGGRLRPQRADAAQLERGAVRLHAADTRTRELATKLGLAPLPEAGAVALLLGGRLRGVDPARPLRGAPHLSPAALAGLARVVFDVKRRAAQLAPAEPWRAAILEGELEPGSLRRSAGDEAWADWLEVLLVESGGAGGPQASEAFARLLLRRAFDGLAAWSFEGGAARLTRALAASVPVRADCTVTSVETESGGARVRYRSRGRTLSVVADAAVVAVPGERVAAICPKLTPEERGFFESVRYAPSLVLHLLLEERPALRAARLLVPASAPLDVGEISVHGDASAGHRVRAELRGRSVARLWAASAGEVEAWLREALAEVPLSLPAASRALLHRFAAGHAIFGPGQLGRMARFASRIERSPRLAFAGDALVGPHVEGAVVSGLDAAEALDRELRGGRPASD